MSKNKSPSRDWYPQHNRLKALAGETQKVGEFLAWLEEQDIVLCKADGEHAYGPQYSRIPDNIEQLLGRYFDVDPKKLSDEKDLMVWEMRRTAELRELGAVKARELWHAHQSEWSGIQYGLSATGPEDHEPGVYDKNYQRSIEIEREQDLLMHLYPSLTDEPS